MVVANTESRRNNLMQCYGCQTTSFLVIYIKEKSITPPTLSEYGVAGLKIESRIIRKKYL